MFGALLAGVNLLTESNMIAGILLNAMFLLGTFTFAVVLGVVSDDISSEVKVLLVMLLPCDKSVTLATFTVKSASMYRCMKSTTAKLDSHTAAYN